MLPTMKFFTVTSNVKDRELSKACWWGQIGEKHFAIISSERSERGQDTSLQAINSPIIAAFYSNIFRRSENLWNTKECFLFSPWLYAIYYAGLYLAHSLWKKVEEVRMHEQISKKKVSVSSEIVEKCAYIAWNFNAKTLQIHAAIKRIFLSNHSTLSWNFRIWTPFIFFLFRGSRRETRVRSKMFCIQPITTRTLFSSFLSLLHSRIRSFSDASK